jgi:hypothetical protein
MLSLKVTPAMSYHSLLGFWYIQQKITMIVDLHHRNSKLIKTSIAPLIHRAAQSQDVTDNATQRSLDVPDIYILCVWICSSLVHNGVGLE